MGPRCGGCRHGELTEDELVVDLRVWAEVTLHFNVLKDELSLIDDRRALESIVDSDSEEHYALGEAIFEDLVLEMKAEFDPRLQRLRYIELIEVA